MATPNTGYRDPAQLLTHLYVEEDCQDLPFTQDLLARTNLTPTIIKDRAEMPQDLGPYPHSLRQGKRHLLLCQNRGSFFKPCPGTREYRCCDYQVLNIGMGSGLS